MQQSESALWEKFKTGDRLAFQSIYKIHAPLLLNYGRRITNDTTLIEDSIHDLFVELWKSGPNLSTTNSIKFYLFRALRWKINRNTDKHHLDDSVSIESYMYLLKDQPFEDLLISFESEHHRGQTLKETLEKLPARQREAINLRYYHNFSNEEIAQIMGVTYNSVCRFITAGLKYLKEHLRVAVSLIPVILTSFA